MAINPRAFIVNSHYPMDFVVGYWTGTVTSSSYNVATLTFSHGLGYTPLIFGMYSLDGGTTWMPIGLNDYYTNQADCWGQANSSQIKISFTALASGSKTAQVKVWGLMPSTASRKNNTPAQTNPYNLNTRDYDYSKLIAAGRWSATTGSTKIYSHNLGYVPEAMVWAETSDGYITPFDPTYCTQTAYIPAQWADITTDGLWVYLSSLDYHSSTITALHYRIYGAQNG